MNIICICQLLLFLLSAPAVQSETATVDKKVFFDIAIGGEYSGRIVFGLVTNIAPLTVANFVALADNKLPGGRGYRGSTFHRVIKNFMIQGGDIVSSDGFGVNSIYNNGSNFDDENFILKNYPGWLGMANAGPNTNGCQIYINIIKTSWLDNKHVVFGKVLSGWDVVKAIEANPTDSKDRPIKEVVISLCGSFDVVRPFQIPIP